MPHITEGLLHARLDGALGPDDQLQWAEAEGHLKVCDDCRRRLEEAAELRDAARDLLAGATLSRSATRPAFDELVARAAARRAEESSAPAPSARARDSWWRRPAALGWAASLVIAAGAGWIGRQLVVEHGFEGAPVAAEQGAPVGRPATPEASALDELREDAGPEEARARREAAAPGTPEPQLRVDQPPEVLQEKAEAGADADAEPEADAIRLRDVAPLAAAVEVTSTARCYVASPVGDDGREAATGQPDALRLASDGTATLRLDGRPMVGFWGPVGADSLRLRVTDGDGWRELTLVEAEDGVRGDADLVAVVCP